jgi:hypothetical protein
MGNILADLQRTLDRLTTYVIVHPDDEATVRAALAHRPFVQVRVSEAMTPGQVLSWNVGDAWDALEASWRTPPDVGGRP